MKGLLLAGFLISSGPCSGTTKQSTPTPKDPAQPTTTPSSGATTPTATTTKTGGTAMPPKSPTVCPSLQIKAPDVVIAGQAGRVTLILTDAVGTPTFKWTVSAGHIESGQGTSSILVHTTNLWGASIAATVEVGGLPPECETTTASATFLVGS